MNTTKTNRQIESVIETDSHFCIIIKKKHYKTKKMVMEASSKSWQTIKTSKGNTYDFNINVGTFKPEVVK